MKRIVLDLDEEEAKLLVMYMMKLILLTGTHPERVMADKVVSATKKAFSDPFDPEIGPFGTKQALKGD